VMTPPRTPGTRVRTRSLVTAAVSALAAQAGAWAVRVHEVRATADAVRVARAVEEARTERSAPGAGGERGAEGTR
ncbi:dihydropteroate synthase, partial [Streptomyces sp. NPDC003388]